MFSNKSRGLPIIITVFMIVVIIYLFDYFIISMKFLAGLNAGKSCASIIIVLPLIRIF